MANDKFTFGSAGEIQDVEFALARNGYTHALVKKLIKGDTLSFVREVLEGRAEICRIDRLTGKQSTVGSETEKNLLTVDYSVKPSLVNLRLESHVSRTDTVIIDPAKIDLAVMLSSGEGSISGKENQKRLKASGKTLLDVRVMEELLKHPELIPDSWKGKYVFFWGTIFRDADGRLSVPCLCWGGDGWYWDDRWLSYVWNSDSPAACLAS
ncbi:MAG: hypothetical protein Q7S28_02600 [bacterium]|nr:hypothetical protein [bacterium]